MLIHIDAMPRTSPALRHAVLRMSEHVLRMSEHVLRMSEHVLRMSEHVLRIGCIETSAYHTVAS